ncbi:antitoxin [Streptomyces sp. R44]|uniref:Antitoxin n=1 Tax=Streptomyces sp. R44 TaxID=3238633 RepID=A0AB39SZW2_9ACTN
MSVLDKLKGMLKGHEDQTSRGIDKAGDMVDERTQGKHAKHVDTAQEKLKEQLGGQGQDAPPPQQ